ncbi:hypothetical protein Q8F55_003290 [Vanrija albida]|uniref:Granulins domain-containing protein n=1 Tax=Vanrija albida TaxID=181172 RepID=A0ABR3Q3M0_9TREE
MMKALLLLLATAAIATPVAEAEPIDKVPVPPPGGTRWPPTWPPRWPPTLPPPGTVFPSGQSIVSGVVGCGLQDLLQCKSNGYWCVPKLTFCCTETKGATFCPNGTTCVNSGRSCRVNSPITPVTVPPITDWYTPTGVADTSDIPIILPTVTPVAE